MATATLKSKQINFKFQRPKKKYVSKRLKKFLLENDMEYAYNAIRNTLTGANYFDLSDVWKDRVSYIPKSRIPQENSSICFSRKFREKNAISTKLTKVLYKMEANREIKLSLSQMQHAGAMMQKRYYSDSVIKVTDEICKYYYFEQYSDKENQDGVSEGSLWNSCMRHEEHQDYVEFYEKLGTDRVQLLVMLDKYGLVMGRALLWHGLSMVGSNIKYTMLDRIYALNDNIARIIEQYANKQGWLTRNELYKRGDTVYFDWRLDYDDYLPYFDTLRYYDENDEVFSSDSGRHNDRICIESTEGWSLNDYLSDYGERVECDCCGDIIGRNHQIHSTWDGNYYCQGCAVHSSYHGTYICENDAVEARYDGIVHEDVVIDDYEGVAIVEDNAVILINGEYAHYNDVSTLVDGTYELSTEAVYVMRKKPNVTGWYSKEDCYLNDADVWEHNDDKDEDILRTIEPREPAVQFKEEELNEVLSEALKREEA